MITFIKLSERNLSRITTFILAAVVCVFLALPANTEAGIWDDSAGGNIDKMVEKGATLLFIYNITNTYGDKIIVSDGDDPTSLLFVRCKFVKVE